MGTLVIALFLAQLSSLHAFDVANVQAPAKEVCKTWGTWPTFESSLSTLQVKAESMELKLTAAISKVVAGADLEATAISELTLVMEQVKKRFISCDQEKQQALKDVKLYRKELQELAEIARADSAVYNWSSISLLAERAMVYNDGDQEDQVLHRAAEMHVGLTRSAKRVAACRRQEQMRGSSCVEETQPGKCATLDSCNVPAGCTLGTQRLSLDDTGNCCPSPACPAMCPGRNGKLELLDTRQAPQAQQPASPDKCLADQEQLLRLYKIAYVHISGLYETSLVISNDNVCNMTVYEFLKERRVEIDMRILKGRTQICDGMKQSDAAELASKEVQAMVDTSIATFSDACSDASWTSYYTKLKALLALVVARPKLTDNTACSSVTSSIALSEMDEMGGADDAQDKVIRELEGRVSDSSARGLLLGAS